MQNQLQPIHEAGIELVGISYDSVTELKEFATAKDIQFPLLSDRRGESVSATIREYKVLDSRESGRYHGVPVPTTVLVDQQKKVRLILPGTITGRHGASELIQKVGKLDD